MTFLKKNWLLILIALFVVELAFFIPWALNNSNLSRVFFPVEPLAQLDQNIEEVNVSLKEQLAAVPQTLAEELGLSRIYFMLAVKGEPHVQSYVFENGAFSESTPLDVYQYDHYYSYSLDGNKLTFFAIPEKDYVYEDSWGAQAKLYVANASGTNPARPSLDEATLLDQTHVPHKQHPNVSPSGNVLFNGWEHETSPEVEEPNRFSIYIVKDGEPAKLLTNGFMPKWISDTEFLFLKNDGLYIANTDLSLLKRIGESYMVMSNNRFDISGDKTMLAWTQPDLPGVFIFKILPDYSLEVQHRILSKAFWTHFSPSNNYLAMETIDLSANGRELNPKARIEFYDMATFQKVPELEINFEGFDQMNMYMTDWAIK